LRRGGGGGGGAAGGGGGGALEPEPVVELQRWWQIITHREEI
jgi:hypothetical protein